MKEHVTRIEIPGHADAILRMPVGSRFRRNVRDGYLRGCGIQVGNIRETCLEDPLFQYAYQKSSDRTLVSFDNMVNIYVLMKGYLSHLSHGCIVEFGSYRGGMAIFMAIVAKALWPGSEGIPGVEVIGFDTFEGIPSSDNSKDIHDVGDFGDSSIEELRTYARSLELHRLYFVEGDFKDTSQAVLRDHRRGIRLAHIDCDTYDSVMVALREACASMVPGGYIVLDDPLTSTCLGAFEAVETFFMQRGVHAEQVFPHMVFRVDGVESEP